MPRKKPFSGKQKKKQLQETRIRKQDGPKYLQSKSFNNDDESDENSNAVNNTPASGEPSNNAKSACADFKNLPIQQINKQPEKPKDVFMSVSNSFRMHFFKESDEVVERKKKEARKPIKPVDQSYLEYNVADVYPAQANLDFPKRPPWNYSLSKEALEAQEHRYFKNYVSAILSQPRVQDLSHFELNLETWRQLWRVLEISDILMIIADIRYPVVHIPPSLIHHILQELQKSVVIVLNKADFVPPVLAMSWKHYLQQAFPGIHIVFFSSFPKELHNEESDFNFDPSAAIHKRVLRRVFNPIGPTEVLEVCKHLAKDKVDLSTWQEKLKEEGFVTLDSNEDNDVENSSRSEPVEAEGSQAGAASRKQIVDATDVALLEGYQGPVEKFKHGIVTIGCIGYPNAGKSSVLNSLVGRKVVSVSQTPGHTKHLQTIFLTPTVRLCDCPGLVFPSMVPKSLQVIAGIFPVAHVREPYSVVGYLAKRINLPVLLKLRPISPSPKKIDKNTGEFVWSAYDICESLAVKNGFTTSKAGRPDIYRAANKILRLAVAGQICLCFKPPNYNNNLEKVASDPETASLCALMRTKQPKRRPVNQVSETEKKNIQDLPQVDEDEEEEDTSDSNVFDVYNELGNEDENSDEAENETTVEKL